MRKWASGVGFAICAMAAVACGDGGGGATADAGNPCTNDEQCAQGAICERVCVPGCRSSRDCPADHAICDDTQGAHGACVQCLTAGDCPGGGAGYTCDTGTCVRTCTVDLECWPLHCDTTAMRCVECRGSEDCDLGNICQSSQCVPGCGGDRDCPTTAPRCDTSVQNGVCVACLTAPDCGASGFECRDHVCVKTCSGDPDCPGQVCNTATSLCVDCLTKDQCSIGNLCVSNTCTPGCETARDCPFGYTCDPTLGDHGTCVVGARADETR